MRNVLLALAVCAAAVAQDVAHAENPFAELPALVSDDLALSPNETAATNAQARLFLSPSIAQVIISQTVGIANLDVVCSDVDDLSGFRFQIEYPASELQVQSVALGDFLGSTGRDLIPGDFAIDNNTGYTVFSAYTTGPQSGATGSGTLATLRIRPTGAIGSQPRVEISGNSALTYLEDSFGTQTAPASIGGSTIQIYFVPPPATPTPTASPTPTPTITPGGPTLTPTHSPTVTATFTPNPLPVVIVPRNANAPVGGSGEIVVDAYNLTPSDENLTVQFGFDPSVIQIPGDGLDPQQDWAFDSPFTIDNASGSILVSLRRTQPIRYDTVLTITFDAVGDAGDLTLLSTDAAVIFGGDVVTPYAGTGLITIGNTPEAPNWRVPVSITEDSATLWWVFTSEADHLGYRLLLEDLDGRLRQFKGFADTVSSDDVENLTGAHRYSARLNAVNEYGLSPTSTLRFETGIGPDTNPYDALFLLAEEWNPEGDIPNETGYQLLIPLGADTDGDWDVDNTDLLEILDIIH